MFRSHAAEGPEHVLARRDEYVPNEVLITSAPEARNDELPHYTSVALGASAARSSYGNAAIDGVLAQMGARPKSVSRVFVPRSAAEGIAGNVEGLSAASDFAVSADYGDDEEARGLSRSYRVTFEDAIDVPRTCAALSASSSVQRAVPNYIKRLFRTPGDPLYGHQWGLPAIHCEEAWDAETGHPDTTIAIVDSGVDLEHPDLVDKLLAGYDFVDYQGSGGTRYELLGDYRVRDADPEDEDGHGSHCAGIAAASSDNGTGLVGVHWGGAILPVRVMFRVFDRVEQRETSVGTDADIDAGIKYAVDAGADVINLSLGGSAPSHETVLQYASDFGVCVVAATGNENVSDASYPASNPTVLAVGAVDQSLARASFSNYGPNYNRFVVAPGVDIASTYKEGGYVFLQGTSMATPFVAGLAALLISVARRGGVTLSPADVYGILRDTAQPLGSGKGDVFFGDGLVDAAAAIAAVHERLECSGAEVVPQPASKSKTKKKAGRKRATKR